jgi:prepilin-type N-terminal cleavage/methylation domain-containing protein
MVRHSNPLPRRALRGFTLIELMISMLVLLTVTAAIFEQISRMQKKSASEAVKLDLNQQAREFVGQTVRDLHMAGYPNASMYAPSATDMSRVATGLVSVSPTSILMEGDVNNDGNVYSVLISYVAADPNDPNCPCVRRGAVAKIPADPLSQPIASSYSETQNVVPPGIGPGLAGVDLFAYYTKDGLPVDVGTGISISTTDPASADSQKIASISTVRINLTLLSNLRDAEGGGLTGTSLSGTAKVGH